MPTRANIIDRDAITDSDLDRFWSKVDTETDPDGCWNWMGARTGHTRNGGRFRFQNKSVLAHRFAWVVANHKEKQDPTKELCHCCDNGLCCNPIHLRQDTRSSNMKDKRKNGNSIYTQKLRMEDAEKIRQLYADGGYTYQSLAKQFNVCSSHISRIIHNKRWLP